MVLLATFNVCVRACVCVCVCACVCVCVCVCRRQCQLSERKTGAEELLREPSKKEATSNLHDTGTDDDLFDDKSEVRVNEQ